MPELDFVFIGPGRSGTTFMDSVLRQDVRIALPEDIKETNFFLSKGVESEREFWNLYAPDCALSHRRGEVANMYVYFEDAAIHLESMGSQLSLHSILRNPFDRLVSSLRFRISAGEVRNQEPFSALLERHPDLVHQSSYHTLLEPYLKRFRARLYLYDFEDLRRDESRFVAQFYDNIGLDVPEELSFSRSDRNRALQPTNEKLIRLGRAVADTMRQNGYLRMLGRLKANRFLQKMMYSDSVVSIDVTEWPAHVVTHLNREIDLLSSLVKKDYTHWKRSD